MTTFYDNQPQSETLTIEQREARYQQERWMGEVETKQDDWLFAPLPSEKVDEDEDTPPEGAIVYNIETMLKDDYDDEGIPHVVSNELWFPGNLTHEQAEIYVQICKPGSILINFTQRGTHDEF